MSKLLVLALAGTVVLAVSGCGTLAPKTSGLQQVHQTYGEEFVELFLNQPSVQAQCLTGASKNQPSFARTRAEIRAYRLKNGSDSPEAAHLTVLDAMMHLQVGNVGLARLTIDRLAADKGKLVSQTGSVTRDYLLAEYIEPLISGWEVVCDLADKASVPDAVEKLTAAATTLRVGLEDHQEAGDLADPATDQGAVYLATTSAIFTRWAVVQRMNDCIEGRPCSCPAVEDTNCVPLDQEQIRADCESEADGLALRRCLEDRRRALYKEFIAPAAEKQYAASRDLVGLFLDPPERDLSLCLDDAQIGQASSASRYRYLHWYKKTNDWSGSQKLACPAPDNDGQAQGS